MWNEHRDCDIKAIDKKGYIALVEVQRVRPVAVRVPVIAFYLSLSLQTKIIVSLYFI